MDVLRRRCAGCGASAPAEARLCAQCGASLAPPPGAAPTLARGAVLRSVDLTQQGIPNAHFKPGRMERRADGVLLNVPAGASYLDMGEGQASARDGCIAVVGRSLDADGGLGVVARLGILGDARTGYALLVHPSRQAFALLHFCVSASVAQHDLLRDWEIARPIRGVGEPNLVELRYAGPTLQAFVNGELLATVLDERRDSGTVGWLARSYGGVARVLLHFIEARAVGV